MRGAALVKFTADRKALLESLSVVLPAVPSRAIKPVLLCVRVEAGESLRIAATDMELEITAESGAEVKSPGVALLPAKRLVALLKEAADDAVKVSMTANGGVTISSGGARWRMQSHDEIDEFPALASPDGEADCEIPSTFLELVAGKVAPFVASERTRYAMNGALLESAGGELRAIGTDGKRLAILSASAEGTGEFRAIIPPRALAAFRGAARASDSCELRVTASSAMLTAGTTTIATRLVEGLYPDVSQVIPKSTPHRATFDSSELQRALRQARVLTSEESASVKLDAGPDVTVISSRSQDLGETEITTPCDYEGGPLKLSFNPDYLLAGLKAVDSESVTLAMSGADTPALIQGEDGYTCLVMPVTLRAS
jgi:DNA polymerase-3 subunit beta